MVKKIRCNYCGNYFYPSRKDSRIKYCSKQCREVDWREKHPKKVKDYSAQAWEKCKNTKPLICKLCNKKIPIEVRKSGLVFCSDNCRKLKQRKDVSIKRIRSQKEFKLFKEATGCVICGYNKYGGSLDFHHIDPNKKERRITATNFVSRSYRIKKELAKCVLLCKNCHYEVHHLIKNNKDLYLELIKGPIEKEHEVKRDEFNYTLLKERLTVLKFFNTSEKEVVEEIKYIENLLTSEVFSEERRVL